MTECKMPGCKADARIEVDGRFCSVEHRVTYEKRNADAREAMLDDKYPDRYEDEQ